MKLPISLISLVALLFFVSCTPVQKAQKGDMLKRKINISYSQAHSLVKYDLVQPILENNFDDAEQLIRTLQVNYERDFLQEHELDLALDTLYNVIDTSIERSLNEWTEEHPYAYAAYLARGIYFVGQGWAIRRARVFSELNEDERERMFFYFSKGASDLKKSLEFNEKLVHSYAYLMEVAMNYGQLDLVLEYKDKAININPYSVTIRWNYFRAISPRWGGSIEKMQEYLNETIPYINENSNLLFLKGRLLAEKGDLKMFFTDDPKYEESIDYYNKAIAFGDHWYYYRNRGMAYMNNEQYEAAINDFEAVINLRPSYRVAHKLLVECRMKLIK